MKENKYTRFENIPFSSEQWHILKKAIDDELDIEAIADERYDPEQLKVLIKAIKYKVDIKIIADPDISADQMDNILEHIMQEMGIYEEHYEMVRRKWLKNISWSIGVIFIILGVGILFIMNKDRLQLYADDLKLDVDDTLTLEAGSDFNAADHIKDYTKSATLTLPDVETNTLGTQFIEYRISNGVKEKTAIMQLSVIDTTSPVIKLSQDYITLKSGSSFSCKEFVISAEDKVDGDLTEQVTCSTFDAALPHQNITYKVNDRSGNQASKILVIDIINEKSNHDMESPSPSDDDKNYHIDQNAGESPAPNKSVQVSASNRDFIFGAGDTFDTVLQQCQNEGNAAVNNRTANGFSCSPIKDSNGIYTGYSLIFK